MKDLVNKIHHIDAIELLCSLPDTSIDMVLCDLPYGVTACEWDTIVHLSDEHEQYDPSPDVWMHVSYQTEEGLQDGWIQHRHLTWFSTPELERIGLARKELDEQERALRHVPNYRLMQLNEAAQGLAHHTKHALQSDYDATLHKRDIEHYAKVLVPMLTKLLSEADE